MSRGYYNSRTPFLYTNGESVGGPAGMDCLQIRQPPAAGPFHYLINEQAKSLVALQELQHEVGALLEFRDLVIETFPNLRTKLVSSTSSSSTPATMMTATNNTSLHHNHHLLTNLLGGASCTITNATTVASTIAANTVNEWTPGVRVRKKLGTTKDKKIGDNTSTIQDSGFSTETSSKETHSASSTTVTQSTTVAGIDETEDELWNLLDVIHRKGTRLKDEVEALQGVLKQQHQHSNDDDDNNNDFQQLLYGGGGGGGPSVDDDLQQLRQERDLLLDRLAEMEAEVLASRVHTSRLQEDLENLLTAKHDLEEQLKLILQHSDQVNTRINDIHLEFITKSSPTRRRGASGGGGRSNNRRSSSQSSSCCNDDDDDDNKKLLDRVLGDQLPKIKIPDREKISAILQEHDPIILQKHLLSSTVQNQVLHQQLDTATRLEIGMADKLDKAREENDELRFQLEDKNIELEGTRARVRMLEQLQKSLTTTPIVQDDDDHHQHVSRREITTASMKAMSPLPMNLQLDHSSSTESAHDQAENNRKIEHNSTTSITKRKPSKIPLKSYTAPKPPTAGVGGGGGGKNNTGSSSSSTTRSRSIGESPASRPHSAQSWRNRSSDGNIIMNSNNNNNNNNNSLSGNKSLNVTKSRNGSSITSKDSLSNKLRNSDSLSKLSNNNSFGNIQRNSTLRKSTTNKWNGNNNNSNNNNGGGGSSNNEKIILNSSIKEKSQFPWTPSSYDDDSYQSSSYPDSLDKSLQPQTTTTTSSSCNYQTTNTFLWNVNDNHHNQQFYDSIDSNLVSCIDDYDDDNVVQQQQNEDLAECDSLEKQLSDISVAKT